MFNFSTYIEEGINDPAIFKAVFLAGGPGSGKSFIVGKTGLTSLGFRVVNSDTAFERAMKDAKLVMNPDNIFSYKGQKIRNKAKELTAKQQNSYLKGRLGLVIDGTGRDAEKILFQKDKLEEINWKDNDVDYVLECTGKFNSLNLSTTPAPNPITSTQTSLGFSKTVQSSY